MALAIAAMGIAYPTVHVPICRLLLPFSWKLTVCIADSLVFIRGPSIETPEPTKGRIPYSPIPPCSRWCQLAYIIQKRYGYKVGDDGGCFAAALAAVRRWGGVLEHPAFSYAWPKFGLPRPPRAGWVKAICGGWVAQVSQGAYGHKARKLTWLYFFGPGTPPSLDWSVPEPTAQISYCANHGDSPLPRLKPKEASRTPLAFRDLLLSIARRASCATPEPR